MRRSPFHQRAEQAMKEMHGYAITFSTVATKGFGGEKVYLSSYSITGPADELVESIQGSVQHERKEDALDEAQVMGERRLSSLAAYGPHRTYHQSWSAS
jgi:hypothetical protein